MLLLLILVRDTTRDLCLLQKKTNNFYLCMLQIFCLMNKFPPILLTLPQCYISVSEFLKKMPSFLTSVKSKFKCFSKKKKLIKNEEKNVSLGAVTEDSNEINEIYWLELNGMKKYNYSDFKDIQLIGRGSFGSVVRARRNDSVFALKSFSNDKTTLFKVVREVI